MNCHPEHYCSKIIRIRLTEQLKGRWKLCRADTVSAAAKECLMNKFSISEERGRRSACSTLNLKRVIFQPQILRICICCHLEENECMNKERAVYLQSTTDFALALRPHIQLVVRDALTLYCVVRLHSPPQLAAAVKGAQVNLT